MVDCVMAVMVQGKRIHVRTPADPNASERRLAAVYGELTGALLAAIATELDVGVTPVARCGRQVRHSVRHGDGLISVWVPVAPPVAASVARERLARLVVAATPPEVTWEPSGSGVAPAAGPGRHSSVDRGVTSPALDEGEELGLG